MIQKEFVPLVEDSIACCCKYFGSRIIAVYLHGSICSGDAIPGISDLDSYIVINDNLTNTDKDFLQDLEWNLQKKYTIVDGVHLSVHTMDELKSDKFTRFILIHNSTLYKGTDIVRTIDSNCKDRYKADKQTAKLRLSFARKCFEDALNGKEPACTGEIPVNTYYAARKFARYFIIIEGAYFLMSLNQFRSFKKECVLSQLKKDLNEYDKVLTLTEKVINNPIETGIKHDDYLKMIQPVVDIMFERIEKS